MIEIVSLDDHPLFSCGLEQCLHAYMSEFHVTGFSQPKEALEYLKQTPNIDLLMLDITMPSIDGISFMHAMHNHAITTPVMIMSATDNLSLYQEALQLGAIGIIPKNLLANEIVEFIQQAISGNIVIPEPTKRALSQLSKFAPQTTDTILSKRQLEILKMVQAGLSNKDIAEVLFISEVTVKSHLQRIFKILGAKNRLESVRKAERLNILSVRN